MPDETNFWSLDGGHRFSPAYNIVGMWPGDAETVTFGLNLEWNAPFYPPSGARYWFVNGNFEVQEAIFDASDYLQTLGVKRGNAFRTGDDAHTFALALRKLTGAQV